MEVDDPEMVRLKGDPDLFSDLKRAEKLTGIRNRSDLIRHAVRMLVRTLEDKK